MYYPLIVWLKNEILTIFLVKLYDSPKNEFIIITCIIGF